MNAIDAIRGVRPSTLSLALSSMFVAAGGFIHLREWLDVYRHVPASTPGAALVRVGFPLNAAASLLVVIALAFVVVRRSQLTVPLILGAVAFQAISLATLVATRVGSVLGWSETTWTPGAEQTRAVGIAALVALLGLAALIRGDEHGRGRVSGARP